MDSFYASCELAKRDQALRDLPFIVGADPHGGQGRGVVLSCNYPARRLGVRSGMPISRAWKLSNNAIYVRPDFSLYGEVSGRIMDILKSFCKKVEQVSIDEAYLEFTDDTVIAPLGGSLKKQAMQATAYELKRKIRENERITCSVGISNSKIVSKIASDFQKPDGLTIVGPEQSRDFLSPLPVEKIPGIGKVSQKILLEQFDIKTIAELREADDEKLARVFGRNAHWMKNVAQGIDNSPVVPRWEPVSESGETTFDEDVEDYKEVSRVMDEVALDVTRRTVNDGYLFRTVGIKIRFSGFETHTRAKTLEFPTDSVEIVQKECEKQLSEFSASGKKVRLIGVRLSGLEKKTEDQRTLLDYSEA
jgi:DNA polymerase IV (archaeal DinB-like DNA polymerase)